LVALLILREPEQTLQRHNLELLKQGKIARF
jgi:hypothetical protein